MSDEPVTLRQYLTIIAVAEGAGLFMAVEAVSSIALSHPDWDMDVQKRTWDSWHSWAVEKGDD